MRVLVCVLLLAASLGAKVLTPVWIELGPESAVLARAVVDLAEDCPTLKADGKPLHMAVREPVPENFKPACEASIPAHTRSLKFGKNTLHLPNKSNEIVVIGDTGCRIKADYIQACDDPNQWPFPIVARQIARTKPDFIIHVGDYLYRETPCPGEVSACQGPTGDNWSAWEADFFSPAAEALRAAPWAFSRGNHENNKRSCKGWFYYLDPRPFDGTCTQYSKPYVAQVAGLRIGMLDSASTTDDGKPHPDETEVFAAQLRELSGKVDWIVDHHPFWLFQYDRQKKQLVATGGALEPAWESAKPTGVTLLLAGHVHLFEFIGFGGNRPNQLVAGDAGTQLDVQVGPSGDHAQTGPGIAANAGEVAPRFGFTEMHRVGDSWNFELKDARGAVLLECDFVDKASASCRGQK